MSKLTQKQLINLYNGSRITIMSFNSGTTLRESAYGNVDVITGLMEIIRQTNLGHRIIVTNKDGWEHMMSSEIKHKGRVSFAEMMPYAIDHNIQF